MSTEDDSGDGDDEERPRSLPGQGTRASEREPASLRIRLRYVDEDTFIEKYSVNISRGGIFIGSKSPRAVGSALRFEFQLEGGAPVIRGEGAVAWVKPFDPAQPTKAHGMGVRFTRLDAPSRLIVERALEWKERTSRSGGSGRHKVEPPPERWNDDATRQVSIAEVMAHARAGEAKQAREDSAAPASPPRLDATAVVSIAAIEARAAMSAAAAAEATAHARAVEEQAEATRGDLGTGATGTTTPALEEEDPLASLSIELEADEASDEELAFYRDHQPPAPPSLAAPAATAPPTNESAPAATAPPTSEPAPATAASTTRELAPTTAEPDADAPVRTHSLPVAEAEAPTLTDERAADSYARAAAEADTPPSSIATGSPVVRLHRPIADEVAAALAYVAERTARPIAHRRFSEGADESFEQLFAALELPRDELRALLRRADAVEANRHSSSSPVPPTTGVTPDEQLEHLLDPPRPESLPHPAQALTLVKLLLDARP